MNSPDDERAPRSGYSGLVTALLGAVGVTTVTFVGLVVFVIAACKGCS